MSNIDIRVVLLKTGHSLY